MPLSDNDEQKNQVLRNACRKKALIFLGKSVVKQEELFHEIVSFVSSAKQRIGATVSSWEIASEVTSKMLRTGEITNEGNFLKLR